MKTIEIVASYSGTVNTGNYNNESPFFSIKEIIEDCKLTDKEIEKRHLELVMGCYDKFQAFKEEALHPLIVKGYEPDPKSSVPQIEAIRQKGIKIITEQWRWFHDNGFQKEFNDLFNEIFKKCFDGELQKLSMGGVRTFDRKLCALKHCLEGNSGKGVQSKELEEEFEKRTKSKNHNVKEEET